MQQPDKIENEFEEYSSDEAELTEEVNDIITAVPPGILRYGVTIIFTTIISIILLAALIRYPDIIKTSIKVNSLNSPKTIVARQGGKLVRLLVKDGQYVNERQSLAYLESTANPDDVIELMSTFDTIKHSISQRRESRYTLPTDLSLGELQPSYQIFYQEYLDYNSTLKNGYFQNRKLFLERELANIKKLKRQIDTQINVQKKEYANLEEEYKAYTKLYKNKVISRSEFAQQENKFLSSKYPLQQSVNELINNESTYTAKERELLELQHTIDDQRSKFVQALNQCYNELEEWMLQHVLTSPIAGKVSFSGIIQEKQNVSVNQEIFVVNPGKAAFFGEVQIPQYNMGKITAGESAIIKLHGYPYQQYGVIRGRLDYVSDVAFNDSVFIGRIRFTRFENKDPRRKVSLKNGMLGEAEIVTEESSLLGRFIRNITAINSH